MPEINEKQLDKLQKLLALIDGDGITKQDFWGAFENALKQILKVEERVFKALDQIETMYSKMMEKVQGEHSSAYGDLRKQVNDLFVGDQLKRMEGETKMSFEKRQREMQGEMNEIMDKKLRDVDNRVSKLKDGVPGAKGDKGDPGPVPIEHLKLMEEMKTEMEKVQKILSNIPRGRAMGRAKVPITRAQNLTSQINGIVNTFTLDPDTTAVYGVFGTQFPVNFNAGTDWTFAGRTLTLVTSQVGVPQSGQTLWALTEVLFYP